MLSRSRSKSGESGAAGRKKDDEVDGDEKKALVSGSERSPSNDTPTRSLLKPKKVKKNARARSQTAGGAQRVTEDIVNRRKQQSALGTTPAPGNLNSRHKSTAGLNASSVTGDYTHKKRKSTAGRHRMMGNFVGERVQSSATTNKPQFAAAKSPAGRRPNTVASPADDEVHSLPELDSNGDIKETRRSFKLPQIHSKKKKKESKPAKKSSKAEVKPKEDVLENGPPSLSDHSKSININLTSTQTQIPAMQKLPLAPATQGPPEPGAKE